jgi:hypothetical protein
MKERLEGAGQITGRERRGALQPLTVKRPPDAGAGGVRLTRHQFQAPGGIGCVPVYSLRPVLRQLCYADFVFSFHFDGGKRSCSSWPFYVEVSATRAMHGQEAQKEPAGMPLVLVFPGRQNSRVRSNCLACGVKQIQGLPQSCDTRTRQATEEIRIPGIWDTIATERACTAV